MILTQFRWDEIIGSSSKLMGRLKLNLVKNQNATNIKKAMEIKRKHQTAIIRILSSVSLDAINRHKLQSLTVLLHVNTKLSTLIDVLNGFPFSITFSIRISNFLYEFKAHMDF